MSSIKKQFSKHRLDHCRCESCVKEKWSRYSKKHKKAKLVFLNIIIWFVVIDGFSNWYAERGVWEIANPVLNFVRVAETAVEPVETPKAPETLEEKVAAAFPGEERTALAVAKSESTLKADAKGWNCRYNGISRACKPEDRAKAWSVDCGVFQINAPGTECPEHLLDPDTNIEIAKQMKETRGWSPWVAYITGAYEKYL